MKRLLVLAPLSLLAVLAFALPGSSQITQDPGTGASAFKECPGLFAAPGDTINCAFIVQNIGAFPAQVTALTETSPFPGGSSVDIECTIAGGTVINEGDSLPNDTPCLGAFQIVVPSDPANCNSTLVDRVEIELLYTTGFPVPLTAGAFATHTTLIRCPAEISITKTADALSKVSDPVNYHFVLTNDGDVAVNRTSVNDTLLGDISSSFPASLAAGASAVVDLQRVVQAGDPDPLPNTVTAIYSAGSGIFETSDTASASASTNLFQPGVGVTKNCAPDPVEVSQNLACTIVISNSGSADSPGLINGAINDTVSGNLLAAGNPAVGSSTCTASLATGASCQIVTNRAVVEADRPGPLSNTVTVHYNPDGFPNDINASATDTVAIVPPPGGEGCTPGYWKQSQHFDSWVGFTQNQTLESVFNVPDALGLDNTTLLQALELNGGGVNALLRHAVAALLNSSNSGVDSNFTTAQVIAATNAALASGAYEAQKNIFAAANEQGCPLN